MTGTPARAPFEVLRFSAAPLNADIAVLELEGRFGNGTNANGSARLLVEHEGDERLELPAVHGDAKDGRWRATFAIPVDRLAGGVYALALRGLLLDLPEPDAEVDGDRHVALARELNSLRHRLGEALEQARSAQASAYEQVQAAEQRVRAIEADLVAVREELAEERRGAEASARALGDALDGARAEGRDLRRALKQSRADVEGLRRELDAAGRERSRSEPAAEDYEDELATEAPADELPTTAGPARGDERTIALEDLPDGESVERVRVLGRDRPRATAAPPPATAELDPAPPVVRYLAAAAIFVVTIVVLMLLLF